MNIIAKSASVASAHDLYALTQAPDREKLTTVKGATLALASWVLYTDVNSKGDEVTLLAMTTDDGHAYCTNSATFCKDFGNAVEMYKQFGEEFTKIQVVTGTSKNGREYIACKVVE